MRVLDESLDLFPWFGKALNGRSCSLEFVSLDCGGLNNAAKVATQKYFATLTDPDDSGPCMSVPRKEVQLSVRKARWKDSAPIN